MERGRQRSCLRSWPSPSINRHSRGRYASLLSSDRLGRAASFDHLVDERQLAFDLGGKHLPLPFPRKAQLLFAAAPEAVEVFQQVVSILQATPLADRSALPDEASTRRHCGSIPEALSGVPIVARRTLVANVPTAVPQCPKWVESGPEALESGMGAELTLAFTLDPSLWAWRKGSVHREIERSSCPSAAAPANEWRRHDRAEENPAPDHDPDDG